MIPLYMSLARPLRFAGNDVSKTPPTYRDYPDSYARRDNLPAENDPAAGKNLCGGFSGALVSAGVIGALVLLAGWAIKSLQGR